MSGVDNISGGYETARLSAAEQDRLAREEREADALRYLTRHGLVDGEDSIAAILGLIDVPGRKYRRVNGHRVAS